MYFPMQGHLKPEGHVLAHGGFLNSWFGDTAFEAGPSIPLFTRDSQLSQQSQDFLAKINSIERLDLTGDMNDIVKTLGISLAEVQRAITTSVSAFPVRENLEAEAKILVPLDTPVRNILPRTPGAGLSSQWRQATSLGGGYGAQTTVTTGASSTTQTVGSTIGWSVGDWVYFQTLAVQKQILTIPTTTTFTFSGSVSTTTGEAVTNLSIIPGSSGRHADGTFTTTNDSNTGIIDIRSFFGETGAPEDRHTYYVNQTAAYKLLGAYGSVSGFAMAAGANFMNQLAV